MSQASRPSSTRSAARSTARPRLGRPRLGRPAAAPRRSRPWSASARSPLDLAALARRRLGRRPADGRRADAVRASPPCGRFPPRANLLIETPAEGRTAALEVLQAVDVPAADEPAAGQVRFTIVDPIGIGRNFGAFMHLADFDAALVTNQVWTDPRQIEERLADLAAHMETVTQKYLRNEYATIEEYNAVAGEVAEPYRVLVVADFPTKFDEKSAGRLAAIAAGGVPCGVLTLVAVDPSKPLPAGFRLDDLRPHCAHLTWDDGRLAWDDPDFGRYPAGPRPAPARRVRHPADPEGRRGGQGRQARRGPVRVHRPAAGRLVDQRQPRRDRRPPRQGRRDQAAAPHARPGHVAARPDRRPDRLGQVDA